MKPLIYQIGTGRKTFQYDPFTYTSSTTGSKCVLSYSSTIPTKSSAVGISTFDTARVIVVNAPATANTGTYEIVVNAVTPAGTKITTTGKDLKVQVEFKSNCDPPAIVYPPHIPTQKVVLSNAGYKFTFSAFKSARPSGCTFTYSVVVPKELTAYVTADMTARTIKISTTTTTANSGSTSTGTTTTTPITALKGVYFIEVVATTVSGQTLPYPNSSRIPLNFGSSSSVTTT